jgi:poly(beta-D-mannuronate) lyase
VLSLGSWKLTLPISSSHDSSPEEIEQPGLANFSLAPYFQLTAAGTGVQFQAPVGGVTTTNSKYPRSELREMTDNGANEASWSNISETHTMTIRQAITHLPTVRPELVAGQIHDDDDYVILIRLEGSHLFVEGDGDNVGTLDDAYKLGTVFTVKVVAGGGHIEVFYNGVQKADYNKSGSDYYFKAGCYTQSNPSKGDDPNDYGQVIIYSLQTTQS